MRQKSTAAAEASCEGHWTMNDGALTKKTVNQGDEYQLNQYKYFENFSVISN